MARTHGADAVYQLADDFRQRCLIGSNSIMWPQEVIWSVENINEIERSAFFRETENGDGPKYWDDVSRTLALPMRKLGADIALLYQLFPSTRGDRKLDDIRYMLEGTPPIAPSPDVMALIEDAMPHGLGNAGRWYSSGGQQSSAWYFPAFARAVKVSGTDVHDQLAMQSLADQVEQENQYNAVSARNMVLHLLFPESYEPISNQTHKSKIRSAFCRKLGLRETDDVDRDILAIRETLVQEGRAEPFGFYDHDLRTIWDVNQLPSPEHTSDSSEPESNGLPAISTARSLNVDSLHEHTYLDRSFLSEIDELLLDRRQLIFEGPPGSGKTFVAEKVARWFTGQPLDGSINDQVEIVQFHQSYGYEDFVQGIRPVTNAQGQLSYAVRDGIFKQLCDRAASRPDECFVLLIDEINRGNISRIFGELLLLLEYRDKRARLPYGSDDDPYLVIPKNLYIIGTMNTADRSLAQIDYALRRRFYFVRFMPVENGKAPVLERWLTSRDLDREARARILSLFIALNHKIEEHLSRDFQIGHSYFMQPYADTDEGIERIWSRAIEPLLEEYLHHHRDRDDLLASLRLDQLNASAPMTDVDAEPAESLDTADVE